MIHSVVYLSEAKAVEHDPMPWQAMLSITDPNREADLSPNWGRLERVQFVDGEYWEESIQSLWNARFSIFAEHIQAHQARSMRKFLEETHHANDITELYVHCWAGQNRSGAVARYVAETFGAKIDTFPKRINKTVYELLQDPSRYERFFIHTADRPRPTLLQKLITLLQS